MVNTFYSSCLSWATTITKLNTTQCFGKIQHKSEDFLFDPFVWDMSACICVCLRVYVCIYTCMYASLCLYACMYVCLCQTHVSALVIHSARVKSYGWPSDYAFCNGYDNSLLALS